ncbi:hypothetical protein LEP1GSC179_2700 [Leptospira santarosai str. MOR084]|uniref:Uncharacterized protein n=1 Tax=Leptospira santarosai str. MOR084 TaxID=1049984 RepID=A0A0E2BDV2_9LEPT|nr:hypothetical protein LEP1GSC179_2700 [Leptospira santarosai str. MOR084]
MTVIELKIHFIEVSLMRFHFPLFSFSEKEDENFYFYFFKILQKTPNGDGDSCDRVVEKFHWQLL